MDSEIKVKVITDSSCSDCRKAKMKFLTANKKKPSELLFEALEEIQKLRVRVEELEELSRVWIKPVVPVPFTIETTAGTSYQITEPPPTGGFSPRTSVSNINYFNQDIITS